MPRIVRMMQGLVGGTLLGALGGCAAPPEAATAPGTLTPGMAQQPGTSAMPFLAAGENGLEVRQWVLSTNAEQVATALMRYRDGDPLSQASQDALERNGLRLVRVPIEELNALLEEIGAPSLNVAMWFGQVNTWREVLTSPVDATSKSLVVSGRVRRFSDGAYNLMVRSWTLMMEDSPKVQLELLGQHKRASKETLSLLGNEPDNATWLPAIRAELLLEHGFAYVLVFESPGVEWHEPGEREVVRIENGEPASDVLLTRGDLGVVRQPSPGGRGSVGPFHDTGLSAIAPATFGEVVLGRYAGQPKRHLLAFVPRIPARLFPPVQSVRAAEPVE